MALTVVRNPNKTNLVLLESSASVAEDGFVSVQSRWLASAAGLPNTQFGLDSMWPLSAAPYPVGLPPLQQGLFLSSRNVSKRNGLVFIDATFVSAVAPVRARKTRSTSRQSFSGYKELANGSSASLSFDYLAPSETVEYSIVGPGGHIIQPTVAAGPIYNFRREGAENAVTYVQSKTVVGTKETIGMVNRYSITATVIYEQGDPNNPQLRVHDSTNQLFSQANLVSSVG